MSISIRKVKFFFLCFRVPAIVEEDDDDEIFIAYKEGYLKKSLANEWINKDSHRIKPMTTEWINKLLKTPK